MLCEFCLQPEISDFIYLEGPARIQLTDCRVYAENRQQF